MARHELKTWPVFFNLLREGNKTFELRADDGRCPHTKGMI